MASTEEIMKTGRIAKVIEELQIEDVPAVLEKAHSLIGQRFLDIYNYYLENGVEGYQNPAHEVEWQGEDTLVHTYGEEIHFEEKWARENYCTFDLDKFFAETVEEGFKEDVERHKELNRVSEDIQKQQRYRKLLELAEEFGVEVEGGANDK